MTDGVAFDDFVGNQPAAGDSTLAANQPYVRPGNNVYNTQLPPEQESAFRGWVATNHIPFNVAAPVSDYDMRGFYKALASGDQRAASAIDPNDSQIHYPDYWKTPYHKTFSNESQWATPDAPRWTPDDKLVDKTGRVLFDDRAKAAASIAPGGMAFEDFSSGKGLTDLIKDDKPTPKPTFGEGLTNAAGELYNNLMAARQGTSPIVYKGDGTPNYKMLGKPAHSDSGIGILGDDGKYTEDYSPDKHVILRDPKSGDYRVFQRSSDTDESALTGLGRMVGFGMLAPTAAPAVAAAAPKAAALLGDFDKAGVDASLPAVTQSRTAKIIQNTLREVPGAAGAIEGRAQTSIDQTGQAAERLAGKYGDATNAKQAGDTIQGAVGDFAKSDPSGMAASDVIKLPTKSTSFAEKAGVLFNKADGYFGAGDQLDLPNTLAALKGPADRFTTNPAVGGMVTNPKLKQFADAIQEGGGQMTFPEVKELRSYFGRMLQSAPDGIPRGDIKQVYGGLSQDLEAAATAKGPEALKAFQTANKYYGSGIDRIEQLDKFVGKSPEGAFGGVIQAAQEGTKGDIGKLTALRRSMPDDQWGNIASATIRQMGKSTAGAADPLAESNFSPATFVTNFSKLSDRGKDILFNSTGAGELRGELDSLVRVSAAQKNVQKIANNSGTGRIGITAGIGAAAWADPISTGLGVLAGNVGARAMMNPRFVRWLYSLPEATRGAGTTVAGKMAQLDTMARQYPDIADAARVLKPAMAP